MSRLTVSVYKLGKDFFYHQFGEIILDRCGLRANPADDRDLQRIIRATYRLGTVKGTQEFSPDDDPPTWMRNLHKKYCTHHIVVGKVRSTASKKDDIDSAQDDLQDMRSKKPDRY